MEKYARLTQTHKAAIKLVKESCMNQELVDKSALEQKLNGIIKETQDLNVFRESLLEEHSLKLAIRKFKELTYVISKKVKEYDLNHYADTIKLAGLTLTYLLRKDLMASEVATAFIYWCIKERIVITGWSVDYIEELDTEKVTQVELSKMMHGLSSIQKMKFVGLQNSYRFFNELSTDESLKFSEARKRWIGLLRAMKKVAEVYKDQKQKTIQA